MSFPGETCQPITPHLMRYMMEGFEGGVSPSKWAKVSGGAPGLGCGTLLPLAHGKNLYFNGCGLRQAVTTEMDMSRARYGTHIQLCCRCFLVLKMNS